jgi:hypothetical protein
LPPKKYEVEIGLEAVLSMKRISKSAIQCLLTLTSYKQRPKNVEALFELVKELENFLQEYSPPNNVVSNTNRTLVGIEASSIELICSTYPSVTSRGNVPHDVSRFLVNPGYPSEETGANVGKYDTNEVGTLEGAEVGLEVGFLVGAATTTAVKEATKTHDVREAIVATTRLDMNIECKLFWRI